MEVKRTTVYNQLVTQEEWKSVAISNKGLLNDFVRYCKSNDKSPNTTHQYEQQLRIFFTWNYRENFNKTFPNIKKRDFVNFFGWGRNDMGWSSNRLASFRAVLSSLSNYIERILDEEHPNFRNVVKVLEPIHIEPVREKTVITREQAQSALTDLTNADELQLACWFSLLLSSGMRKSELLQMKVEFFVPENIVFDLMYRTPKIRTKGKGKAGKQVSRYVFAYEFQPFFDSWMAQRDKLGIKSEYLFVTKTGDEYTPAKISTLNSWAKRVGDMMGVELYSHSLRHYFVTNLRRSGYPAEIIQKLQNWADSKMVDVYSDISHEEELDDFFKGKKEEEE